MYLGQIYQLYLGGIVVLKLFEQPLKKRDMLNALHNKNLCSHMRIKYSEYSGR
jgi:hypothetical protein